MKAALSRLLSRLGSEAAAREIDEELRFHLELLTEEHLEQGMPVEEAKAAAVRRFGNVEQTKDQCLASSRLTHPFLVALKAFLTTMFLAGVVLRILSTDLDTSHLGELLIAVPILSRLLLYVRSLKPSNFLSKPETSSPLRLNENVQPLLTAYDQGMLAPVERRASHFR